MKLRSLLPQTVRKTRPPALFMTEASALRFAREYGIMPQLLGRREIKVFAYCQRTNNTHFGDR
jgi:hypothetical protein